VAPEACDGTVSPFEWRQIEVPGAKSKPDHDCQPGESASLDLGYFLH
jgi:hypothetical protein